VVERIAAARAKGLPVYAETCPQYLYLTDEALERPGVEAAFAVCAPPLRSRNEQERLWRALADQDLHSVSTDHCPFPREDKAKGLEQDFSRIPGGVPSIEGRFAMLYQGVVRGVFPPSRWVDLCCTTPARLMGFSRKGRVAEGYDADLVVFDPQRRVVLSSDTLHENIDWTPYEGVELTGWPAITLRRGEILVENGAFKATPGSGRFVHRVIPADLG
jgi:dihydropyrimidinase